MSTLVNWNGQQYLVPSYNDTGYAQGNGNLSQYLVAISTGSLQQVGGLFQLTADADFGPNFGLVSSYYKSRTANIASAGVLRLANTDAIKWRNSDNSADVTLAMNATGTAARTYTIPDLATSYFVMTEGDQTINGSKTFGSAILGSLTGAASLNLLLTGGTMSGDIAMGGNKLTGIGAGTSSANSISMTGAARTGFYFFGANPTEQLWCAVRGVDIFGSNSSSLEIKVPTYIPDGSAAAPSIAFTSETGTGIAHETSGYLSFVYGGAAMFRLRGVSQDARFGVVVRGADGAVSSPSYSFTSDEDTGIYLRSSGNGMAFAFNGTMISSMTDTGGTTFHTGPIAVVDGSAATPPITFLNDRDTGMFLGAANRLDLTTNGATRMTLSATSFNLYLTSGGQTFSFDNTTFIPVGSGTGTINLGTSLWYWADVSYKTLTDRGCLPFCDDGVELADGKIVSDTEAIKSISKHPTKKTVHGLPMLDYKTFPKKSYKPADDKGVLLPRDENDEPIGGSDGIEMTMMFGVFIGAIKELTDRIEKLEKSKGGN